MATIEDWPKPIPINSGLRSNKLNIGSYYNFESLQPTSIYFYGGVYINLKTWEVTYPEGLEIPEVTKLIFDGLKHFAN